MSITAEGFKALSNKEKGSAIENWFYSDKNWEVEEGSWDRISKQLLAWGSFVQTWKEADPGCQECETAQSHLWLRSHDCNQFFNSSSYSYKKATRKRAIEGLMEKIYPKSEEGKKT